MMDQTSTQTAEPESRIDKLQAAADGAAGEVRNLYIAFLSFGLYLAITVGATTDEQLLHASPVRLPIVDVGLPLVAFYWIAPLLFVLFHFNLLVQLHLLSEKLHRLDLAIRQLPADEQRERRATFSQFVFSQMLIGDHRSPLIQAFLHLIAWATLVILPVAVLLLTQVQFLPYHDPFTTWWHRVLIVLDLLLLWLLWLKAIDPAGRLYRQVRVVMRRRAQRFLRRLAEPFGWLTWLIRALSTLPGRIRRRLRGEPKQDQRLLRLQELSAVSLLLGFLIATIPGEFLAWPVDTLSYSGDIGVLNRNLSLREVELESSPPLENIAEGTVLKKYIRGLDLRGRDLRFADLHRADLRKADFREGASLQGAALTGADLRGAILTEVDLRDAFLLLADLRGADLAGADLQGADLIGADLRGSDLRRADLRGVDLVTPNLQHANLAEANLQGVDLRGADLRGVDLRRADLRAADLAGADLQGASLRWADLRGADLAGADLQGADLRRAQIWRATIGDGPDRDSHWDLVDLRGAGIDPVDLEALIAELEEEVANDRTREVVIALVESALRDDERPDVPSWQVQPNVMFIPDDPIAATLGWAAPALTGTDYDEKLATYFGDMVCADSGSPVVAQMLGRRPLLDLRRLHEFESALWATRPSNYLFEEPNRLLYRRLAQRLTSDDAEACPGAAELPEDLRSRLKRLAARPDHLRPDHATPSAASTEMPLRDSLPSELND